MSKGVVILLIIALGILFVWAIGKLLKCIFNLVILIRANKHPEDYSRTTGGVVFNKKTGKLEETSGDVILPF